MGASQFAGEPMSTQRDPRLSNEAAHIWHVWMNRRNQTSGQEFDHSPYEFKSCVQFLEYGHQQIQQAFEGTLPKVYKHCSLSPAEPLPANKLKCCLGTEVITCPILLSAKEVWEDEANRRREFYTRLGKPEKAELPKEDLFQILSHTCAWHIFTEQLTRESFLDTSEGYLLDETDRQFWSRTYESLAGGDEYAAE